MEYLKPIEIINSQLRKAQVVIACLMILLGICLVIVPRISALGSPVIVQTDAGSRLASVQPWKAALARMDGFARAYLGARFDWSADNFTEKRELLRQLADQATYSKLKDSMNAFEGLAREQKARSYYVLEQIQFANGEETLKVSLIRVLRIKNVAFATPLTVTLSYENAAITESNPYGLVIKSAQEVENETH